MKMKRLVLFLSVAVMAVGSIGMAQNSRLDTVKKRGKLICGVNNTLPGFGFLESNGNYSGFDTDFCRAVAAAVFGDPNKVDFKPLTAAARFTAVQSGEVDVVFRNSTATLGREASGGNGVDFVPVNYYDGQGVMVKATSKAKKISDLEGATICAIQGTTTEQNISDYFRSKKKKFQLQTYADLEKVLAAFVGGRCDAITSDTSQLAAAKASQPNPKGFTVLAEVISKEPLAGFVAQNDSAWRDVVTWTVYALFQAEEFKMTSRNIDSFKTNTNPVIRRFIGLESGLGKQLGLSDSFAVDIVKGVGNYLEIFDRHLGKNGLGLQRGKNKLFSAGGLFYSPPFR